MVGNRTTTGSNMARRCAFDSFSYKFIVSGLRNPLKLIYNTPSFKKKTKLLENRNINHCKRPMRGSI